MRKSHTDSHFHSYIFLYLLYKINQYSERNQQAKNIQRPYLRIYYHPKRINL